MRVQEIMTTPVQTVPPTMPAGEAKGLMRRLRIHHLVVKEGSSVVGIVSDRDLRGARGGPRDDLPVSDVMTAQVVTTDREDTVRQAANRMRGRTIGCLPVMSNSRVVGIVTISDLLDLIGHGGERRLHGARASLHYRVPHGKRSRGHSW